MADVLIEKGKTLLTSNVIKMLLEHANETEDLNTEAKILLLFCNENVTEEKSEDIKEELAEYIE